VVEVCRREMKPGDKVIFVGCSVDQINWGSNDDPNEVLSIGAVYTISKVDVHSWHTKIYLEGFAGKFNSVCFEMI
jgi:hypothetical protein